MEDRVRIGVSACLLGEKVRYDGGHKRDPFITKTLSAWFEFVPVCPEAECGLGVPREAMHLTGNPESPRLVTRTTGRDLTDRMLSWARARLDGLAEQDLCGFIFKSRSPSSGMERVPVYTEAGMSVRRGRGLFAAAFMDRFPRLPVEDEGRLSGMGIRENFIERVFTLRRWRDLLDRDPSVRGLMGFHAAHKLLIMSHSPRHMREMGRLAAAGKGMPAGELFSRYEAFLMEAMALKATPKKHSDVLMHMMGYFKKDLSGDEKRELLEVIEDFRKGLLPLVAPLTLLSHYVRKYGSEYLAGQAYLSPHPAELGLRNHA